VLLHLNLNVQIACRCAVFARFTFAGKTNAIASIHTRRDFDRQRFGFLNATVTVALIAWIFDQRTATMTVRTGLLHGEEALTHLHLAGAMTGRTGLRLGTCFSAATVADVTLFQGRNADLFRHAANSFFQRQVHVVAQIGTTRRTLTTTATAEDIAKHVAKDIAEVRATAAKAAAVSTAAAALFKRRVAVLIVGGTLLGVGQDLVGFFNFFEFCFGLFVTLKSRGWRSLQRGGRNLQ
jgi:hypothetical protein